MMSDWGIGTTYWPRRKGSLLWTAFDRGAVRDELQQIVGVGFDTVRLPLHWGIFSRNRSALPAVRCERLNKR